MEQSVALEIALIEELTKRFLNQSVAQFEIERERSLRLLSHNGEPKKDVLELSEYLKGLLTLSLGARLECMKDEDWREGIHGAILAGRNSLILELLEWIQTAPCSNCGNDLSETAKFCDQCGTEVK